MDWTDKSALMKPSDKSKTLITNKDQVTRGLFSGANYRRHSPRLFAGPGRPLSELTGSERSKAMTRSDLLKWRAGVDQLVLGPGTTEGSLPGNIDICH